MALLEIEGVHAHYGNIHALKGISLEVEEGEIVTLIGANGAGKSTTLKAISGLLRPTQGDIRFKGQSMMRVPPSQIVKMGISQVPEGRKIFSRLTVQENLEMGAYTRVDPQEIVESMESVFASFPRLQERLSQRGGTLSGGEQQMLAMGRGLMSRPELLLLDEPSMGLAPILVEEIFEIIKRINAEGTSILLVEQNAAMALSVATR
ncbi:MAG: ABC transporter ATP-binding protein, partial [Chloroflexi bacterium RBG_13_56_8]